MPKNGVLEAVRNSQQELRGEINVRCHVNYFQVGRIAVSDTVPPSNKFLVNSKATNLKRCYF